MTTSSIHTHQKETRTVIPPNGPTTKLNIFYGRCSTDKQQNSIQTQLELVKNYCQLNDIILDEKIIDYGYTGSNVNRDGYQQVLKLILNKKVGSLIVLSLSRWGRSVRENAESIELMKKNDVNFISIKEQINLSNPMGVFFCNIMSSLYELEISLLRERTSDVLQSKKMNGKVYTGSIPFGYNRIGNKLVINNKEQKILRKINTLKQNGLSYQKIADYLNRNNHRTKNGKVWERRGVYYLLKTDRSCININ